MEFTKHHPLAFRLVKVESSLAVDGTSASGRMEKERLVYPKPWRCRDPVGAFILTMAIGACKGCDSKRGPFLFQEEDH